MVWLGCWKLVSLVLSLSYRIGLCGTFDVTSQGEELLELVIAAWHRMQPPLSTSQTTINLSLPEAPKPSFSPTR
jgi:hypothetical protein